MPHIAVTNYSHKGLLTPNYISDRSYFLISTAAMTIMSFFNKVILNQEFIVSADELIIICNEATVLR